MNGLYKTFYDPRRGSYVLAVTTDTVETARVRHDLWPVATAALGRAMTGAILLAGDLKP